MADYVYGNYYLSESERQYNAQFIWGWIQNNWTEMHFPVAMALLGNFEQESTINPGLWQNKTVGTGGFGLAQWTPASKLFNWIRPQGLADYDAVGQLRWIKEYTIPYGQWVQHASPYNISFTQWVTSTSLNLDWLTACFCVNWEMAGNAQMANRQRYTRKWAAWFGNEDWEPVDPNPDWPTNPEPGEPGYPYPSGYYEPMKQIYYLKPYWRY